MQILYFAAFLGGALMILAPCSAALIPAYFANTFRSKKEITKRTTVFFLGFAGVYAFIGVGASFVGRFLNIYQDELAFFAGIFLLFLGILAFTGKGLFSFSSKGAGRNDKTLKDTFVFGATFSLGYSACSGPILAGILTVASQLSPAQAILLMLVYSLGIGTPLIILSLLFDKYNVLNWKIFSAKIKNIPLTNVISGSLLLVLGVVFIVYRSTFVLSAAFPQKLTDASYAAQNWLLSLNFPSYIDSLLFVVLGFAAFKMLQKINFSFNKLKIKKALIFTVVILFAVNSFVYFSQKNKIEAEAAVAEEAARPAGLSITIIVDEKCVECVDINTFVSVVKKSNVKIINEIKTDYRTSLAKKVIEKYGIEKIPSIVVVGEINKNKDLKQLWEKSGKITDGETTFVLTSIPPPYVEFSSGKIRGEFILTYLGDSSCAECYDVKRHLVPLSNLGMKPKEEKTIDIESKEGKELIEKYNIQLVPTIILEGDLDVYSAFNSVWSNVGDKAEDGVYVFRKVDMLGTYKNLDDGRIITVE